MRSRDWIRSIAESVAIEPNESILYPQWAIALRHGLMRFVIEGDNYELKGDPARGNLRLEMCFSKDYQLRIAAKRLDALGKRRAYEC
jgi:hypothetical protein